MATPVWHCVELDAVRELHFFFIEQALEFDSALLIMSFLSSSLCFVVAISAILKVAEFDVFDVDR
jgi:hypothetical protein